MSAVAQQGTLDFGEVSLAEFEAGWQRDFEALGGTDAAGWLQDLVLYFDLQWDVATGSVGPTRYFIAPLILEAPFDCREISAPEAWNVPQVYEALEKVFGRLYGPAPILSSRMVFRTEDLTESKARRAGNAKKRFCYTDRAARCGRITLAPGCRYHPAHFAWE